jgi:hypothetical protein
MPQQTHDMQIVDVQSGDPKVAIVKFTIPCCLAIRQADPLGDLGRWLQGSRKPYGQAGEEDIASLHGSCPHIETLDLAREQPGASLHPLTGRATIGAMHKL